jgi:hypothetical protein
VVALVATIDRLLARENERQDRGPLWIVYRGEPLAERQDPRGMFREMWTIAS